MKDQFNPGPGGCSVTLTVGSTHNPSRYGDYFTVTISTLREKLA